MALWSCCNASKAEVFSLEYCRTWQTRYGMSTLPEESQSNGNLGATNVSKVNMHSLLYPGNRTKIYAHLMPWFGDPRHMSVGYNSQDPEQLNRQITDMISRGIDGVIIDWYGSRDSFTNTATLRVMTEAEQHPEIQVRDHDRQGSNKVKRVLGMHTAGNAG